MRHAFEPFFTTKQDRRGTGLGLSMVYGFVKQSGGNVTIYSAIGSGTTINLYFPRVADTGRGETRKSQPRDLPRGTERILVVEDDLRLRERTAASLRALGYVVSTATDGTDALRVLSAETEPDLVLTDVVMPGLDGPGLVSALSESHPSLRVMLMTGYAEASTLLENAIDSGAPLIHKPFTRQQLAVGVREYLDG